jgi:hypothetical protein
MKIFLIVTMLLISLAASAQEFNAETYVPTYTLAAPAGWGIERFAIPIDFAPAIPYKGIEDLRFAPGWSDANANDYWTYCFLWYLEGKPELTPQVTEKNLTAYYTGLIGRNIAPRKIPKEKLVPVKVTMKETSAGDKDLHTYSGTIEMLDYMAQKPITLNCIVHVRSCTGKNNTFMFYQISPQPLTNNIWKDLQQLWTTFDCKAAK